MRRGAGVVGAVLVLLAPGAAKAGSVWHGGGAPDGLAATRLVAEPDGTLVAMLSQGGVAASIAGAPFQRFTATRLDLDAVVVTFQAVAGGLRAIDDLGDVYASSDHGRTWHLAAEVGQIVDAAESVNDAIAVAVDRAHPERMILAFPDGGVQRSPDGGASWFSARPVAVAPVQDPAAPLPATLAFAPDGSVYLRIGSRLWRSADFADTWTLLAAPPAGELQVDPVASEVLWVAGPGGLSRSSDGGHSWQRRRSPAAALVLSAVDADVAWAIDRRAVRITTNGGASWRGLADAPHVGGSSVPAVALPGHPTSICIDDAFILWCSDGGAFTPDAERMTGSPGAAFMVADPVAGARAVTTAGRLIWETTDGSASWHRVPAPLDDYGDVVVTAAGTFVAGSHGIRFSRRGSLTWRRLVGPSGVASLAADVRSGTVYARTARELWRLDRRSTYFRRVAARGLHRGVPFLMSVGGRGRTIAVTGIETAVSTDGGAHFQRTRPARQVAIVAASPFDRLTLVAATTHSLLRSADGGRTWHRTRRHEASQPLPDPWHRGRWFASSANDQILISTDDARSWRVLSPAPPKTKGREFLFCCLMSVGRDRLWATVLFDTGVRWRHIDARRR